MTTMMNANSTRRVSTFSDKNLTTLESLVLEVALEDAKQKQQQESSSSTTPVKECEMSASDHKAIIQLQGNDCCADCESPDTEWASVSFGILLCAECSGIHRALGTHISRIRSTKMDNWSPEHLDMMKLGGNQACQRYLEKHGVGWGQATKEKYSSEAAQAYKHVLKDKVLRKQGRLDETESSTEGSCEAPPVPSSRSQRSSIPLKQLATTTPTTSMDDSCASFAAESIANASSECIKSAKRRPDNNNDNDETESEETEDDDSGRMSGGGWAYGGGRGGKPSTLDSWFNKTKRVKPKIPASARSKAEPMSDDSAHSAISTHSAISFLSRRTPVRRSHSTSSAPTITYMGRSFSADGSDDAKLLSQKDSQARFRRQSDIKLLSDMADQQDEIAREALNKSWRRLTPDNHWTADKKVEPFRSSTGNMPSGPFGMGQHNNNATDRRGRHQENLRRKLAYTDADLLRIAQDDKEFARLKAGLKNKGAVTNEILKQKLYAFVAKSKLRKSETTDSIQQRQQSKEDSDQQKREGAKGTKSEILRSKTIHTNTALRL